MTDAPRRKLGRPPIYGAKLKARTVKLDEATVEKAKALGGTNLSEGIRRAVAEANPLQAPVPAPAGTPGASPADTVPQLPGPR